MSWIISLVFEVPFTFLNVTSLISTGLGAVYARNGKQCSVNVSQT
ncbi:hypothetical protein LINPERHAP2_LOCUS22491 [Linum perenne]